MNNERVIGYEIIINRNGNLNNMFNNVFNNVFTENVTFGDILDYYIGDMMQYNRIDPLEIALRQSLEEYKHAEKKPIKLELKDYKFVETEKKHNTCTICQDDFNDDDIINILECEHYFHKSCISEWGKYKPECPNCQKDIKYYMENSK